MAVVYVEGTLQISGINLKTADDLQGLEKRVIKAVFDVLPEAPDPRERLFDDVEFEVDLKAGDFEE